LVKSFGLSSLIEPVTFYTIHISYKNGKVDTYLDLENAGLSHGI